VGVISWLRERLRGGSLPAREDPIEAYDRRIDALSGRGSELRRAAATLLALRGELERGLDAEKGKQREARARLEQARGKSRADVSAVLSEDLGRATERMEAISNELAQVGEDAKALGFSAKEIEREAEQLRRERSSAAARLSASVTVARAAQAEGDRLDEILALDRARDEVERARALAEVCKEDLASRRRK
jgi:phage shock protein A